MCPGPPQYKHRRFARRRCFSASDRGPRCRATSISIGVGPLIGVVWGVWLGIWGVEATIEAYVCSVLGLEAYACWRSERRSNRRLSHRTALLIASVSDFGSSWKVRSKSFTSLRKPYLNRRLQIWTGWTTSCDDDDDHNNTGVVMINSFWRISILSYYHNFCSLLFPWILMYKGWFLVGEIGFSLSKLISGLA